MSDFVIENIPVPVVEPKRRGRPPGAKNRPKGLGLTCKSNTDHSWNSSTLEAETCVRCGEVFPCKADCTHVDCNESKGLPLPAWYLELASDRMALEQEITPPIDDVETSLG